MIKPHLNPGPFLLSLAGMALLIVLLAGCASPPPGKPAAPGPDAQVPAEPDRPAPAPTAQPSSTPAPSEAAPQEADSSAADLDLPDPFDRRGNHAMTGLEALLFNGLELELSAPLPEHPALATLFRRQREILTPEGAQELAAQMGIRGVLERRTAEAGNTVIRVSNDVSMISVNSDSPPHFIYGNAKIGAGPALPFEERAQLAEEILKKFGLLNFPYRLEPVYLDGEREWDVAIVELINDMPLYAGSTPWMWLTLDSEGQVFNLAYQRLRLQAEGEVPVRAVEAVWADLQAHRLDGRAKLRLLTGQPQPAAALAGPAQIEQVELVYFAMDTGGMWVGGIPADNVMRIVQPVWRFVGKLADGTGFEILAESAAPQTAEAAGADAQAAEPEPTAQAATATGKVIPGAEDEVVNVRSGPGALYDRVGTLSSGQVVTVTGRSPHAEWWQIKADGLEGWVYAAFLMVENALSVPCIEPPDAAQPACAGSTPPVGNEQAEAIIRAFINSTTGGPAPALTFRQEEPDPNADMRNVLVYMDSQGGEYRVDAETLQVKFWNAPPS